MQEEARRGFLETKIAGVQVALLEERRATGRPARPRRLLPFGAVGKPGPGAAPAPSGVSRSPRPAPLCAGRRRPVGARRGSEQEIAPPRSAPRRALGAIPENGTGPRRSPPPTRGPRSAAVPSLPHSRSPQPQGETARGLPRVPLSAEGETGGRPGTPQPLTPRCPPPPSSRVRRALPRGVSPHPAGGATPIPGPVPSERAGFPRPRCPRAVPSGPVPRIGAAGRLLRGGGRAGGGGAFAGGGWFPPSLAGLIG